MHSFLRVFCRERLASDSELRTREANIDSTLIKKGAGIRATQARYNHKAAKLVTPATAGCSSASIKDTETCFFAHLAQPAWLAHIALINLLGYKLTASAELICRSSFGSSNLLRLVN